MLEGTPDLGKYIAGALTGESEPFDVPVTVRDMALCHWSFQSFHYCHFDIL